MRSTGSSHMLTIFESINMPANKEASAGVNIFSDWDIGPACAVIIWGVYAYHDEEGY